MTGEQFAKIFKLLDVCYEWFRGDNEVQLKAWYEMLKDIPYELLITIVKEWIATQTKPPTIADLRKKAVYRTGNFPSTEEAWSRVVSGGELTDEIKRARKYVGGGWAISHSTNPEALRSQFAKAYENAVSDKIEMLSTGKVKMIGG